MSETRFSSHTGIFRGAAPPSARPAGPGCAASSLSALWVSRSRASLSLCPRRRAPRGPHLCTYTYVSWWKLRAERNVLTHTHTHTRTEFANLTHTRAHAGPPIYVRACVCVSVYACVHFPFTITPLLSHCPVRLYYTVYTSSLFLDLIYFLLITVPVYTARKKVLCLCVCVCVWRVCLCVFVRKGCTAPS